VVLAALARHPQRWRTPTAYARFRSDSPWRGRDVEDLLHGLRLPAHILREIRRGPRPGPEGQVDRSAADFRVVKELLRAGCDPDRIRAIYERAPIGAKHRERAAEDGLYYLARTVGEARRALAERRLAAAEAPTAGHAS